MQTDDEPASGYSLGSLTQNYSVLVQILLSDLIGSGTFVNLLRSFAMDQSSSKLSKKERTGILEALNALLGSTEECLYSCTLRVEKAHISQIRYLSRLLLRSSQAYRQVARKAYKVWMLVRNLHDVILLKEEVTDQFIEFFGVFDELKNLIFNALKPEVKDENILYYVLRQWKAIDVLMHSGYTISFFEELFPGGLKELEKLLIERYEERGFSFLKPLIKEQITHLRKNSL